VKGEEGGGIYRKNLLGMNLDVELIPEETD